MRKHYCRLYLYFKYSTIGIGSTGTKCEARSCINAITALSTQDCIDWIPGCELVVPSCSAKSCNDAPSTANTDTLCG